MIKELLLVIALIPFIIVFAVTSGLFEIIDRIEKWRNKDGV